MSSDVEWKVLETGHIFDLINGHAFKSKEFLDDGAPVLKIKNIKAGALSLQNLAYVDDGYLNAKPDKVALHNDLLISMSGNRHDGSMETWVGKVCWFGLDKPYLVNQRVGILRLKPSIDANPRFLAYQLSSEAFQHHFIAVATSSGGQANLSPTQIKSTELLLPPKEVQDWIVDVAGGLEDKIELNKQINQTLEQMAQAIFKSWFVDFEPVKAKVAALEAGGTKEDAIIAAMKAISGKDKAQLAHFKTEQPDQYNELRTTAELFPSAMQDSEMGEIPEGWAISTVGEEFDVTMGQSPPGDTYNEIGEGAPFFQGRRDFGTRFPRERIYCSAPKRMAKKGDTLLSVRAPVGDSNIALVDCCIGRGLAALRHKTQSASFTYYSVIQLERSLSSFDSEGTVFGSINQKNLKSLTVVKPSNQALSTFDKVVSSFDLTIQALSEQTQKLEQLRDGLLPKLLSGELGVCSLDNHVGKSEIDDPNDQLYTLINDIEKELPTISHFKDIDNFVEEYLVDYEPSQSIKIRSFTTKSLLVKGESAEGGAEYFKLPAFLSALRNNKTLDKLFAAVVDGISGVPLLMDAVTSVMGKYLGRKIRLNQRTAIVLLAFPKELNRKTSELLENARRIAVNSGLRVIDEDELYSVLHELKRHGLVEQVRLDTEQWKLVEKFRHEIDHWQ